GTGVSVDLKPDSNLNDDGGLPLHGRFPRFNYFGVKGKIATKRCQPTVSASGRTAAYTWPSIAADRRRDARCVSGAQRSDRTGQSSVRGAGLLEDRRLPPRFDPTGDRRDRRSASSMALR